METWKPPIPRQVHFIWIGDQKVPDYFTRYFKKSFEENMPEFTYRLWTTKDLTRKNFPKTYSYIQEAKKWHGKPIVIEEEDDGGVVGVYDILDESGLNVAHHNKWAQMSDLMRLEIIYNHGGYYFDINFEILPSRGKHTMYNLLNSTKKQFVGCNEIPRFKDWEFLSNSFFGATKHNKILQRLLTKENLYYIDFESSEVGIETGPGYLRGGIYSKDSYHIFPTNYFYPFYENPKLITNYIGRKIEPNKCHKKKTKQKSYKKLQKNKGYIEYPCQKYPRSYALKHWQLGRSWKTF